MTALLDLLGDARRAGLVMTRREDQLIIRGPRSHERLVRALLDRKSEVLTVLPVWTGAASRLDWRRQPVLDEPRPCALCRRSTLLVEPFDQRPCHKTCAEAVIRWGTVPAMQANGGRAA